MFGFLIKGLHYKKGGIMLLYIGNSRWTNSSKGHAVHICGADRRPLCGKSYRYGALDVYEGALEEVTCSKCKIKTMQLPSEA